MWKVEAFASTQDGGFAWAPATLPSASSSLSFLHSHTLSGLWFHAPAPLFGYQSLLQKHGPTLAAAALHRITTCVGLLDIHSSFRHCRHLLFKLNYFWKSVSTVFKWYLRQSGASQSVLGP